LTTGQSPVVPPAAAWTSGRIDIFASDRIGVCASEQIEASSVAKSTLLPGFTPDLHLIYT
jgi:hypothetical protein